MKQVTTLAEATAHFENSFDTIICSKEGAEPVEVKNLGEAREYYGFEEEKAEPPVTDPVVEDQQPVVEGGEQEQQSPGEEIIEKTELSAGTDSGNQGN